MNPLFVITPYKYQGNWVFDDPHVGLDHEPFVMGADSIMDHLVVDIPNAARGFKLLFSASPFPEYAAKLEHRREEFDGNWYYCGEFAMEAWLCPALFKYFPEAPSELYVRAEPNLTPAPGDVY